MVCCTASNETCFLAVSWNSLEVPDVVSPPTELSEKEKKEYFFFMLDQLLVFIKFYCNSELSDFWRVVNHGHRFWQF